MKFRKPNDEGNEPLPLMGVFGQERSMLEEQIIEAIKAELQRQAADKPADLSVETGGGFRVSGTIDLDALAMAVAGSVVGGP